MKKDILFLCQFFYPETVSSATLPFDTASFLADAGYMVGALCGFPKEYTNDHSTPLKEEKNGVEIKRMKYIQLSRVGSIGRLINYFSFTVKALLNIGKLKNYKSVIVYSNPPVLPIIPILAKKLYGTKLVFVAYDLYPEIAYASKSIVSGSFLDKVMKKINDHLYKNADAVVALTYEMKQFLLNNRKGLESDRVFVIENWAHEKETTVLKDETYEKFDFKKNQFIVGYFGNLGTCQDVDTILDTALRMKNDNRFGFLIVGHGNKKEKVKEFIEKNNLENIKIFDYLVGDDFKQAVAMANCSIVSLEKGLKGTCAPSKYYSCLLGGHPVIALVEDGSYLAKEVENEKIGHHIQNGDSLQFKKVLEEMYENPEEVVKMGERAKQLYAQKYDFFVAMQKYKNMFEKIL